jgi:hypothetical protein
MMIAFCLLPSALVFAAGGGALQAVPFTDVKIESSFWAPRIILDREKVLPHNFRYCESAGKIDNFLKQTGRKEGKHLGAFWEDSDVYKVIEGAAYCLAPKRDAEIERHLDEWVDAIGAAQLPDGYLNTYFTMVEPQNRWTDDTKHETYCLGHMIEAAVAYFQATGKRKFLDIAIRATDQMDSVSGPGKLRQVSGHEEIELALVKLWRVTGDDKYLALSRFMIDGRGHMEGRSPRPDGSVKLWGEYCQDHKPVREQTEILGHAVRAMYLYSGVADIAAIDNDTGYINAMDLIWRDVTGSKMYITGGIGPSARNEGFTVPYDLPNETAYCETCAAIGMAFWNQRLALLHADAKYADIVERVMYNGALSGVSLNGEKYFYVNPLASAGRHHRQPWHACACCPTNIVRFLPAVGGYAYATGPNGIYVNQYIAGKARMKVNGSGIALTVITEYPWDGLVGIAVELESETAFALFLRIPGWAQACDDPGCAVSRRAGA